MTDAADLLADDTPLQPFRGSVERPHPVFAAHGDLPWRWEVEVTPLELPGHGKTFEVRARRFGGPKLEGTPDPVGVRIAQVDDVIAERVGERAREIALRAVEELRVGAVPDLKKLADTVRGAAGGPVAF